MSKKHFALGFDAYGNDGFNKFFFRLEWLDVNEFCLLEHCESIISDIYPDIEMSDLTVKITLFNNIDTGAVIEGLRDE